MIDVPATELAIRDWLRADQTILDLVNNDGRKIDVDYSGTQDTSHITLRRAGGDMSSTVPLDRAVMMFDCWAKGRGSALTMITALTKKLINAKEEQLNDTAYLRGWTIVSNLWMPDDTGQPRYVLTAIAIVSARNLV